MPRPTYRGSTGMSHTISTAMRRDAHTAQPSENGTSCSAAMSHGLAP